jgi:hypothetical protein
MGDSLRNPERILIRTFHQKTRKRDGKMVFPEGAPEWGSLPSPKALPAKAFDFASMKSRQSDYFANKGSI